jgi:hypothetical protein
MIGRFIIPYFINALLTFSALAFFCIEVTFFLASCQKKFHGSEIGKIHFF